MEYKTQKTATFFILIGIISIIIGLMLKVLVDDMSFKLKRNNTMFVTESRNSVNNITGGRI